MTDSVPSEIVQQVEEQTGSFVRHFSFASGGCINHGGCISTSSGDFFIKWNDLKEFPKMFVSEARGLTLLQEANALTVPKVVYAGEAGSYQFLLLEYLPEGKKSPEFWKNFGSGLARLHMKSADVFGLDHDNYIGSLAQRNTQSFSWVEFFIEHRLKIQLRMARDKKILDDGTTKKFDTLFNRLPSLLPEEQPSLLHGDLWGGNLMVSADGQASIIDPAVYFGHREMDIAMTKLFGGFDYSYLESYQEVFPLQPGFEDRLGIYNLYPLLVHVNLFGKGYISQILAVLRMLV